MSATCGKGSRAVAWSAVCFVLAFGALPGGADIYNGDFEAASPLDGWGASSADPPGSYVEAVLGPNGTTAAHLHAETTYTYENTQWTGTIRQAYIQQLVITLLPGETHLQFEARAVTQGIEVDDPSVSVFGGGGGGGASVGSETWGSYSFPLLDGLGDPLPPGTHVSLVVLGSANPPTAPGTEGQQVTQVVDLWVDNFHLVPLPQTGLLLLAGAAALLRRRKR